MCIDLMQSIHELNNVRFAMPVFFVTKLQFLTVC